MQKFYLCNRTNIISVSYIQFKRDFRLCRLHVCDFNSRNCFCICNKLNCNGFVLVLKIFVGCFEGVFVVGFQAVKARCGGVNVLHLCAVLPQRDCAHLLVCKRFIPHKTPFDTLFSHLNVLKQHDCVGIDCFFVESVEFCAIAAQIVIQCDNTVLINGVWSKVIKNDACLLANLEVLCQHIHTVIKHSFCISAALFDE